MTAPDKEPVSPDAIDKMGKLLESLFEGPLPEQLQGGEWHLPISKGLDKLTTKSNEVVKTFGSNAHRYPPWFIIPAKDAVEKIAKEVPKLVAHLEYAVQHYVPVLSLYVTASKWTTDVMTPLSEVAGTIKRDLDSAKMYWDDKTREIYSEKVSAQEAAVSSAKQNAADLSSFLATVGTKNVELATEMVDSVAEVLNPIVAIIVELASVVGSPFALQDLADTIGTAVENFIKAITRIIRHIASTVQEILAAKNKFGDHENFPDGAWPKAVAREYGQSVAPA